MKLVLSLLAFVGLAACSSGGGGGGVPCLGCAVPTVEEQKQRTASFSEEVEAVNLATGRYLTPGQRFSMMKSQLKQISADRMPNNDSAGMSQKAKEYSYKLDQEFSMNNCQVSSEGNGMGQMNGDIQIDLMNVPQKFEQKVEILNTKSNRCPIYAMMHVSGEGSQTETGNSTKVAMVSNMEQNISIKEGSSFYDEVNLFGSSMSFNSTMNMEFNNSMMDIKQSESGVASFETKDEFEGNVSAKFLMEMDTYSAEYEESKGSIKMEMQYQFRDFTVAGEVKGNLNSKTGEYEMTFYINGDQVSQMEFLEYFGSEFSDDTNVLVESTFQ